jgi:hypothetical protein
MSKMKIEAFGGSLENSGVKRDEKWVKWASNAGRPRGWRVKVSRGEGQFWNKLDSF